MRFQKCCVIGHQSTANQIEPAHKRKHRHICFKEDKKRKEKERKTGLQMDEIGPGIWNRIKTARQMIGMEIGALIIQTEIMAWITPDYVGSHVFPFYHDY